jgi:hypothetical protein
MFLMGAFLIMGLYYLCIFFLRKEDRSSLYFVLLCLIAIGRTMIYGGYFINRIVPWGSYPLIPAIDYNATTWVSVVFAFLVGELFPEQSSRKLIKLFAVYAAFISLFVLLTPIHIYTTLSIPSRWFRWRCLLIQSFARQGHFPKTGRIRPYVMAGILAVISGGVHDLLYHNNIISSGSGELATLASLSSFSCTRLFWQSASQKPLRTQAAVGKADQAG